MRLLISSSAWWIGWALLFTALSAHDDLFAQELSEREQGPVYVAYAGPYSSSPPSAFGHLFLVLPEDSEEALPLWDVVSFSAETNGAGPLKYLTVGIGGGFRGSYQRLDFHEKTRDYQLLDDRDLWLTEVVLTPAQRQTLADALEATTGQWYPYTFFERNCAYYLQWLLAQVVDGIRCRKDRQAPRKYLNSFYAAKRQAAATSDLLRPGAWKP